MSRMLKFSVPDASLYDLDGMNVDELVAWADAIREQVPAEYRATSKVEYESGDYVSFDVTWERLETPEEEAARVRKANEDLNAAMLQKEQRDRALYEQLKARFGQ